MPAVKRTFSIIFLLLMICGSGRAFAQNLSAGDVIIGVRTEIINETVRGTSDQGNGILDVDNVISPFMRINYEVGPAWHLEMQGSADIYGGKVTVDNSNIHGDASIRGYTLSIAPAWQGAERNVLNRPWHPVLKAGLRYAWLDNGIMFPVSSYKPACGADISCGMVFEHWEIRLNATYMVHNKRSTLPGYSGDNDLNLSRIGLEVAVPAQVVCDLFSKD